jgi:phytol kinase
MVTLVVFYAVFRGNGHPFYEALAREKDAPRRTYYVVTPYFATLAGGLATNILFGPAALFGYLVTGVGDAIGEPVGTRYGKHPCRVFSWGPVQPIRTVEGSVAVGIASCLAVLAGIAVTPGVALDAGSAAIALGIAVVCAAVEAVAPHGWDNAFLQVVPSALAAVFFGRSPA